MRGSIHLVATTLALAAGAGSARAGDVELPGGGSAAFRARMTDWSAPDAPARRFVEAGAPTAKAKAVRLPRLSSRFGYRSDPMRRVTRLHAGIDIPGPLGTPVLASGDGVVRFAGSAGGYGHMVEIAHGAGLATRYAHLSRILVRPGEPVARGERIALMGSTGRSTGSHLHFEVRRSGRAADPLPFLESAGGEWRELRRYGQAAADEPHISRFARARADHARAE